MGSRRFIIACFLVNLCYVLTFSNVVSDQQGSTWSTINPSGGISQKGSSTETSNENISKTPASNSLVNGTNNETKSSNPSDESSNSGNKKNKDKNGAILRGFSVIMGVTGIVVVYFIIRAVRLRRKRSKTKKYGIIAKSGDLEMTPLDQDDDDDDTTVFEAQNHIRK